VKVFGRCRFCPNDAELCLSHAIPDGIFKLLMRAGNGSAIDISSGTQKIRRSSDSGAAPMLCKDCETDFNNRFDAPITNILKGLDRKIQQSGFSSRLPFSHDQFAQAIVSIVWRCCESTAPFYKSSKVDNVHLARLKQLTVEPQDQVLRRCSVSIARLTNPSRIPGSGFGQDNMYQLITAPIPRTVIATRSGASRHFGFDFVLQGFLIHLVVPRLPYAKTRKANYLNRGGEMLHAPPTDILKYPPLKALLLETYAKAHESKVTPGVSRSRRTA
jgi:hypothetical protein